MRIHAIAAIVGGALLGAAFTVANANAGANSPGSATLAGNHPAQAETLPSAGDADADQSLTMEIRFAVHNRAALDQLLEQQQDPNSPNYHKWLKSGEFDRRFGATPAEIDAVVEWLDGEGFTVRSSSPDYVRFSGTVGQAEHSFAVRIVKFGDGAAYANTTDPTIPSRFAGVIGSILGLDNMSHAVPATRQQVPRAPANGSSLGSGRGSQLALSDEPDFTAGQPGVNHFGPQDLRIFYDEAPLIGQNLDGTGNCIAIIGASDFADSALEFFDTTFGLPASTVTRKVVGGRNPGQTGGLLEQEALLDVEYAHAIAPGAGIVFYVSRGDLIVSITAAVNDNLCGAISISFDFCSDTPAYFTDSLNQQFSKAAAQGQSVFVAAGDVGVVGEVVNKSGTECVPGRRPNVNEASANPNVTAVGGTSFNPDYDGSGEVVGPVPESAWNDSSGATGGGASRLFKKPSYQKGLGVPADGRRDVPDIALVASLDSPGAWFADERDEISCCVGGTSLATPLWAGFSQVIAQARGGRLGNLNFELYALAQQPDKGIRDVTIGNNSFDGVAGFSAGPGYDQTTGWGTVDMAAFESAFPVGPLTTVPKNPAPLAFVEKFGQTSASKLARLRNPKANRTISVITGIALQRGTEFTIDPATTTCVNGLALPANRECRIGVRFTPAAQGIRPADALVITDNSSNSPQIIPLSGRGD